MSITPLRHMGRALLLVFLSVSASVSTFSQITILQQDFYSIFTPGGTNYYITPDPWISTVNVGHTGGPNLYDFSSIQFSGPTLSHNFVVDDIPVLASRFPSGAVTFGAAPDTIVNNPVFVVTADTIFLAGKVQLNGGFRFRHYTPRAPVMPCPLSYGQSFVRVSSYNDTTYDASWNVVSAKQELQPAACIVDGFGTLRLPGHDFDCLRLTMTFPLSNDREFLFLTRNGLLLDINLSGPQPDTGMVTIDDIGVLSTTVLTSVGTPGTVARSFSLEQNWPNPCNPSTTIAYNIAEGRQKAVSSKQKDGAGVQVRLAVYDLLGREVAVLVNGYQTPGEHSVVFNGSTLASGVYVYRLTAGGQALSRTLVLLK